MYILDIFRFKTVIEYEYKYFGNYGAKGEKRKPRRKATPEEIKANNQRNKAKKVRRLILANFSQGDYWTTLTYPKDTARNISEVTKDLRTFLDRMRRAYKRAGIPFKYIYRIEIGSRGGIHVHILMNRMDGLDLLITEKWEHGHANLELMSDDGESAEKLGDYITKPPTDQQIKIIRSLGEGDVSKLIRYSCSRNLEHPEPERQEVRRGTMHRIFDRGIKPTPGFYVATDTIRKGRNPYTGTSYLKYSEYQLTEESVKKMKAMGRDPAEKTILCECPICHQLTIDGFACDCQRQKRMRKRGSRHG